MATFTVPSTPAPAGTKAHLLDQLKKAALGVAFRDGEKPVAALPMTAKVFSTGSVGYNANGKITLDGVTYQVSVNLVAVNSKAMPEK